MITLQLTPEQAAGLLALAAKGRVLLDVDPSFLAAHAKRQAAREGVRRLRALVRQTGASRP